MGIEELLINGTFANIVQYVLIFVTNIGTFFLTRKRYKARVRHNEIHNLDDAFKIYNKIIADLELRVTTMQDKLNRLEEDFEELKEENKRLKEENLQWATMHSTCEFKERKDKLDKLRGND